MAIDYDRYSKMSQEELTRCLIETRHKSLKMLEEIKENKKLMAFLNSKINEAKGIKSTSYSYPISQKKKVYRQRKKKTYKQTRKMR